jgi:peptidylprolyl isomerase
MITQGSTVEVHYTGRFLDGEVFDSSEGKDPLQFEIGSGQIIPGFENALMGKNIGEKVSVTVAPDEAYGQVREDLVVEVPADKMPGPVEVGQLLQADGGDGLGRRRHSRRVRVKAWAASPRPSCNLSEAVSEKRLP